MERSTRRSARRAKSLTIAQRRLSDHRFWVHQSHSEPDHCWCQSHPGANFWDTHRPLSCNCRKRKHGRPKVWGDGMCCCDDRRRVYRWRQQERQFRWTAEHEIALDWDADRMALLTSPTVLPRS